MMPVLAPNESGFPLGSGQRHTQSVPLARALGFKWLGLDVPEAPGQGAVSAAPQAESVPANPAAWLRLPCRPAASTPQGSVDLRAVAALLDHAGAPACYAAAVAQGATATLELRIDFADAPPPGQDVLVQARCVHHSDNSALVQAQAQSQPQLAQGRTLLARMQARYVVGLGPGRANDSRETAADRAERAARHALDLAPPVTCLDELLGLRPSGEQAFTLAFQPWLVGAVALPALHGGVVAAGLISAVQAAAQQVAGTRLPLSAVTLQFLRAAAAEETRFAARVLKAGARAVYVQAEATQQGGRRQVASLQALLA